MLGQLTLQLMSHWTFFLRLSQVQSNLDIRSLNITETSILDIKEVFVSTEDWWTNFTA
jgi:hypothetical protein